MKCGNSAFNAQGSRVIIVVVQVGAVKIYAAAVEAEALRKKERGEDGRVSVEISEWVV
jgi:mRNA-degrading endonuclease toxin of MazEF toxin-antitoxin module